MPERRFPPPWTVEEYCGISYSSDVGSFELLVPVCDLLCRIGPAHYNALLWKHQRASVVAVNGYPIRTDRLASASARSSWWMGWARALRRLRALALLGGGTAAGRGGD